MAQNDAAQPDSATNELPKQYRPADHEPRIWKAWTDAKAFHADPGRVLRGEAPPYCILIPPPNVTAALHLGHALNNTLQDILARAHRMRGFETLWMPGTDHAGIATQAVVEKRVMKDEKKRRTDFSREAFVEKIQAFKDEYEAVITNQLKAMGCSCDWDRQRFTMDEVCASAVREAFFRLFKDGLIYRGKRLVNWDPALQTAVADDECYDEEIDGAFYYLRYPLVHAVPGKGQDPQPVTWDELAARGYPGADEHAGDLPAWVTVATTRPETYLGDTAVALNPHDPRAKALRGVFVELPLVGRVIPIIEDAYVVLPERYARTEEEKNDPKAAMATGFLKVTPAHDPNDYELGQRHKATIEAAGVQVLTNIFAPDGRVSDKHGWSDVGDAHIFVGKKREEARKLVKQEFEARGLFEGSKPHRHSVKHSDRSKAIIEPYLSDQWYVKVTDPRMAKAANEALLGSYSSAVGGTGVPPVPDRAAPLTFFPARYAKTYEQWHDGIRDWCISRQLWWGHRIPVWTLRTTKLAETVTDPMFENRAGSGNEHFIRKLAEWRDQGRVAFDEYHFSSLHGAAVQERDFSVAVRSDTDGEVIQSLEAMGLRRDPDVLDTWFSSALWPLSTLGWPDPEAAAEFTHDPSMKDLLAAFNPTSTLCTAREIITLWVSRMVMFNRYFLPEGWPGSSSSAQSPVPSASGSGRGPVPFRDVFIHAVIQDGEGRKMSKSLGNGVDPLDIIATHGSDAMRFTLCQMTTNTQDVRLPVVKDPSGKNTSPKFDLGRNFATKLWNAAKFAMTILSANPAPQEAPSRDSLTLADRWMLSRLAAAIQTCDNALADYEFSVYAQTLYSLLWNDFCDWYLEAIKPSVAENPGTRCVLRSVLDAILRLLHPVMPFVTETIFEALAKFPGATPQGLTLTPPRKAGLLCLAGWPQADATLHDAHAAEQFEKMRTLVSAIREIRAQHNVPFKRKITLHPPSGMAIIPSADLTSTLAGLEAVSHAAPAGPSVTFIADTHEYRLSNLADEVDEGAEKSRLTKLVADLDKSIATLEGRLNNPGYAQKAPPNMVQQTKDQLTKAQTERAAAAAALAALA